jgi:lipopolysaccharide transport system permease protein
VAEQTSFTEYFPNQRFEENFWTIFKTGVRNIIQSRDLIYQLFKRDFFAQYKKSFIGIGWAIITPVFGVASWLLMQLTGVLSPGQMDAPYPVYLLVGSAIWGFFVNMVNAGATTLQSGSDLIQQIKYPHEAMLFKQVLIQAVNFFISFFLILLVVLIVGFIPSWKVVFLPLLLLPLFFAGAAAGLLISIISVVATDISRFVNHVMVFLIYTVPVIYSDKIDSAVLQNVIAINPLTYLVCSARDLVLYGRLYDATGFWTATAASVFVFALVWKAFYLIENRLVERMV